MDVNAKLRIDHTVSPDVERLAEWDAFADLSAIGGTQYVGIFFRKKIELPGIETLYLSLHPRHEATDWYWYARPLHNTIPTREGMASSLTEAIAAVDAAGAEITALAPA